MTEQEKIDSRRKFVLAFNDTMVKIWQERILLLHVTDKLSLYGSVRLLTKYMTAKIHDKDVSQFEIDQGFLTYGLWQNYGVGKETYRGNPGDIGRPKVRKKKPWFDRKYFGSVHHLRDFMAESFAQQCVALFSDAFSDRKLRQNAAHITP